MHFSVFSGSRLPLRIVVVRINKVNRTEFWLPILQPLWQSLVSTFYTLVLAITIQFVVLVTHASAFLQVMIGEHYRVVSHREVHVVVILRPC